MRRCVLALGPEARRTGRPRAPGRRLLLLRGRTPGGVCGARAEPPRPPGRRRQDRGAQGRARRRRGARPARTLCGDVRSGPLRRPPRRPRASPRSPASAPAPASSEAGPGSSTIRPATAARSTREDILVVPFTDVGWTPVLANAGGIVAETGGQLSHTSIIAREFGIPAVVSVRNATRLIREGQTVTVDGTAGRVYPPSGRRPRKEAPMDPLIVLAAGRGRLPRRRRLHGPDRHPRSSRRRRRSRTRSRSAWRAATRSSSWGRSAPPGSPTTSGPSGAS